MSLLTANFENKCISINDIPNDFYAKKYKGNITCRCCSSQLKAVLNTENVKHFSHLSVEDCDSSSNDDNLLLWHRLWQSTVISENTEYIIEKKDKKHRADIYIPENKYVIEIQHSNIEKDKINDRELFYDKMIWIIDGTSEIDILKLCEKCTKISDLCKNCLKSTKNKNNNSIEFEGKNFYIIQIQKKFYQNMSEEVFIHCDGFICKYIAKLKGNNILCEKISFEELFNKYFLIKDSIKIKDNFNKLYFKSIVKHNEDLEVEYNITEDKLIINSDKSNKFTDYGFTFNNGKWTFTYVKEDVNFKLKERLCLKCNKKNDVCNQAIELNTKLCFECNKKEFLLNNCESCKNKICDKEIKSIDELITQVTKNIKQKKLCDKCHIKSITCNYCKKIKNNNICDYCNNMTMRWYSMFKNNDLINKGEHIDGYSEIIVINNKEKLFDIQIKDKITFNFNKDSKYICKKDNFNIYFVDYNLIEIIKINNEEIYRTKLDLKKNSIIDTLGDHLFLISQLKNDENDYILLSKISKKKFINEINNIFKQKLEIDNYIPIEYKYFDFDAKYSKYNGDIKTLFYKMHSKEAGKLDLYDLSEKLSNISNKNEKIFEKFMEWFEDNRDKSNDHTKILNGKDKGKNIINFNLKELKNYTKTNAVVNKDILLTQNKSEITKIYFQDNFYDIGIQKNYNKQKNNIPTLKQSNHKEGWVQDLPCYSCGIKCYAPIWNKTYYALCKMCFNGCPDIDDKKLKDLLGFSELPNYKEKFNKTKPNLDFID